ALHGASREDLQPGGAPARDLGHQRRRADANRGYPRPPPARTPGGPWRRRGDGTRARLPAAGAVRMPTRAPQPRAARAPFGLGHGFRLGVVYVLLVLAVGGVVLPVVDRGLHADLLAEVDRRLEAQARGAVVWASEGRHP